MKTLINAEAEKNYKKSITMAYMAFSQIFDCDLRKIFHEQGIHKIAIYGMGEEGRLLYWLLRKSNINIGFVTDKEYEGIVVETTPVLSLEKVIVNMDDIDLIIVSTDYYFNEIRADFGNRLEKPIVSARVLLENSLMCARE